MPCHYWYFTDAGFEFKPHVFNECHDALITACELRNIAIWKVKGVDYRCILWGISKNEAFNILDNSMSKDTVVL